MKLYTDIQALFMGAFPDLSILMANASEERQAPYLLIEGEAVEERIKGNNTWEHEIRISLSVNAHDWSSSQQEAQIKKICDFIQNQLRTKLLRAQPSEYLAYSLRISSITSPEVNDEHSSQRITLSILTQQ